MKKKKIKLEPINWQSSPSVRLLDFAEVSGKRAVTKKEEENVKPAVAKAENNIDAANVVANVEVKSEQTWRSITSNEGSQASSDNDTTPTGSHLGGVDTDENGSVGDSSERAQCHGGGDTPRSFSIGEACDFDNSNLVCEPSGSYSPTNSLVDRAGSGNASSNDLIEVKCEPGGSYSPTDTLVDRAGNDNASNNDQIEVKCEPDGSYSPTDYPIGQAGGPINATDSNKTTNVPDGDYRPTDSPIDDPVQEPSGSYSPTDPTSNSDEDSNTIMRAPIPKETCVGKAGASQQYDETRTFLDLQKDNTSAGADLAKSSHGARTSRSRTLSGFEQVASSSKDEGTAAQKSPRKAAAKESSYCGRRLPCR